MLKDSYNSKYAVNIKFNMLDLLKHKEQDNNNNKRHWEMKHMNSRIKILKDIMEIEKQYALEKIDSEVFETKIQVLEQQFQQATALTDEELREAIDTKEIPLSANSLIGKISIEDLIPNYKVPRTFFRHLKIRREISELERNVKKLEHDMHKIKILLAEKKVNQDSAARKLETLEYDLRLARNRFGAREKYLKRNPSKGYLLKFTLQNFLQFSYGHGVANDAELSTISTDLKKEINLRNKYRDALAELLATLKATQLEIRSSSKIGSLPDFKKLREFQQTINELLDYIKLLTKDIKNYNNCLCRLDKDHLKMDESHELFVEDQFGIEVDSSASAHSSHSADESKIAASEIATDPLIETLSIEEEKFENTFFLIDTLDIEDTSEEDEIPFESEEIDAKLRIPQTPQLTITPDIDLEIVGMEDFNLQYNIKGSPKRMNELTEKVILNSFEEFLTKLLDSKEVKEVEELPKPKEVQKTQSKQVITKVTFSSLAEEVEKRKTSDITKPAKIDSERIIEAQEIGETFGEITEVKEINALQPDELDAIETTETEIPASKPIDAIAEIPSIPDVDVSSTPLTASSVEEASPPIQTPQETGEVKSPSRQIIEENLVKPQKTSMISEKLLEAATEAWKLTGKALFNLKDDGSREFYGYLQEAVVYDKNKLGYTLVTEPIGDQVIIDKIFDQIKPLWVTEELLESATKRKIFVIQEVVDSLQIERDVALHISKLQEFANFRNISYPSSDKIGKPEILGLVPINKIRIKRGSIICNLDEILPQKPYRTAPWLAKDFDDEDNNPIGKNCLFHHGISFGTIIASVKHPLMGKIFLVDTKQPDKSIVNYLVQRLNISEDDPTERLWLLKYLIAKQLRLPEGEALKPKTLINYSLQRGFPILPHEILNSYRVFISGGSINSIKRNKVTLKNSARVFHPSEVIPIECLRVRTTNGRHLGTCLGISLSDKPVLLISEKLSREMVGLFTNATVEKQIMTDISDSVIGSIGVELRDSLCPHNILKTLVVGRKIQTLAEYGHYLSKMIVTGIDLSRIQVVEKGTVYITATEIFSNPNIFGQDN